MSAKAEWKKVEARANAEFTFAAAVTGSSLNAFYPEMQGPSGRSNFTNTLGSDLIPDLLTSEGVVVDLYDWANEDVLIQKYGVDLKFLEELRDAKLIQLCANVPFDRYRNCNWLHSALADKRTIWRSIRTPAFLTRIDPEFETRRKDREGELKTFFDKNPDKVAPLSERAKPADPPKTGAALANMLSHWIERVISFDREILKKLTINFEKHAYDRIPELRRIHGLVVSPYSAALDGKMKVWHDEWETLFGTESISDAAREGLLRTKTVLSYLSEVKLNLTGADLKTEATWHRMSNASRLGLLDYLKSDKLRRDMIAAEQTIRLGISQKSDAEPGREEIREYVNQMERSVERVKRFWDLAAIAAPVGFGHFGGDWATGWKIGIGMFASKRVLGSAAQRCAESFMPRLQLVRILRKQ